MRGSSRLDKIADAVNSFCGSMWVFIWSSPSASCAWLFLGNIVGFDKTPWPLLLTILNLPQLSIMISLQVSANRAQAASDKRAIADHETLIALHEMGRQQLDILHGQDQVLDDPRTTSPARTCRAARTTSRTRSTRSSRVVQLLAGGRLTGRQADETGASGGRVTVIRTGT